jgi:photosystem II stability/assembly factor-like uncharacterized protein
MKNKFILVIIYFLFTSVYSLSQQGWIYMYIGYARMTDICFINYNTGYITGNISSGNLFFKTTNGGLNWTSNSTGNGNLTVLKIINESNIYMLGNVGNYGMVRYSNDGGAYWNDYYFGANQELMSPQRMDWLDTCIGYSIFVDYGGSNYYGRVFRTTNGGTNWIEQFPLPQLYATFYDVKIKNYDTAYLLLCWGLVMTTNQGNNWVLYDTIGSYTSTNFFFPNYDTIYLGGTEIKRSTDKGITWMTQHTIPSYKTINKMYFVNARTGWAVGGGSSYYSQGSYIVKTTNAGTNWILQDSCNYKCLRSVYFFNENTGWIVGDSGTVLKTTTGGNVWISKIGNKIPDKCNLYQNYPNPFNPKTKIKFDIAKSEFVTLKIYNALGKEVETLINEKLSLGTYEINWDASQYPSGIYFYRLRTDNFNETKKMIMIK